MRREGELPPGIDVSRETLHRLRQLLQLILRWTPRINLIAPSTKDQAWHRHIVDSAQLWPLAPGDAAGWIDLGSGAGLPGLVVAAIAAEKAPGLHMRLVESDQRKCVFLREAVQQLELPVTVEPRRIESLPAEPHDVVTARALAPLPRLLPLVHRFAGPGTTILLPKGAQVDSELTLAHRDWHIRFERVPSLTDPAATILKILELEPLS